MKLKNNECFHELSVFLVEVPVSEQKSPEVVEAKKNELENLRIYKTFEEVDNDKDIKTIGSRYVITQKEKHNGKKTQCKARLVARRFQEEIKPQ